MKKSILFIILGCLSIYGFSINPIDPPAKTSDCTNTITAQSPVTIEECSDLCSLVNVTVIVTITDCPNKYTCNYPDSCSFNICIYEGLNLLGCQEFDIGQCSYTFENLRADENVYLYSKLVPIGSCSSCYNHDFNPSSGPVPFGGGTVYIYQTFCCEE